MTEPIRAKIADTAGNATEYFKRLWQTVLNRPSFLLSSQQTPSRNGELVFEATNDTTLTFRYQGADGVVRSGTITLT